MAQGFRSLAGPWIGGLAHSGAGGAKGFRSLFAPWIGGLSNPVSAPGQAGFVSLTAFWIGGLSARVGTIPPEPTPERQTTVGAAYAPPDIARTRRARTRLRIELRLRTRAELEHLPPREYVARTRTEIALLLRTDAQFDDYLQKLLDEDDRWLLGDLT